MRFAKAQFEALDNSLKITGNPGPEFVGPAATALKIADRYPDQLGTEAAKLRGALAGQSAGFAAASAPDGGSNLLDAVIQTARQMPADPLSASVAEHTKAGIEAGRKLLQSDPAEYARQAEWILRKPADLALNTPEGQQALPQSVQDRASVAAIVASRQGLQGRSMFSEADLPQVKSLMAEGPLDQRVALLNAIGSARVTQPVLQATIGDLSKSEETQPLAIAANVAQFDPVTARQILSGQDLLKSDKYLSPKAEDFGAAVAQLMPVNDFPNGPMRQSYMAAAKALYAARSGAAGEKTDALDNGRLTQAVQDITGGLVDTRGSVAMAPWPKATQDQFDAAVRQVTDADLVNAKGRDGASLPASYLLPSLSGALGSSARFRLESYGQGKYLIYSGPDDRSQRQYLLDPTGTSNGGQPGKKFVLDLGAKRGAVEAAAAGSLSSTPFSNLPFTQYLRGGAAAPMGGPM